jgi:myo-inositol-1(or 4)-monophosphatase
MNLDWNGLTDFAIALANASAQEILPYFRRNADIEVKSGPVWDPVTEGDRAGERIIRQMIEERYPDHGIHGEEYGRKEGKSGFTWILDPVDGTRSFVCGMPTWATLIGLMFEGRCVVGLMNQPVVGDLFFGNPHGAWHDYRGSRHKIKTRTGVELANARIGTTAPELYRTEKDQAAFQRLRSRVQLTRFGGDAYFFAVLAAGHLDIAMDANLMAYDIMPLIPIVEGAGGCVAEWNGGDPARGGNVITAGSRPLLEEALAVMKG